jgi:ubiquinone biosynthesis protein
MNFTPAHHQTSPAAGDHADLGVAARAVNATNMYGKGDAEVRAHDGVTVDFAPGYLCIVERILAMTTAAVMVLVGTTYDRLRRPRASFDAMVARRVRRAFERLGPTFVKAGQLMSSSFGSLPKVWVEEMARCRDEVPATPWGTVSQLLIDELGDRLNRVAEIDPDPLAAGSMAQVHGAVLRDTTPVAIKVLRPGLEKILVADVGLLRHAARLLARFSPTGAAANPLALVDDFAAGVAEQLSFFREATNIQCMAVALGSLPVYVPTVFTDLSTDRVLVMERLEGVPVDDLDALNGLGLDPTAIARTIVASLIVPAIRKGIFHGDMHPGNMLVLPDGQLALLDFGVLGRLDAPSRALIFDLLAAMVERRFADVALSVFSIIDLTHVDMTVLTKESQAFLAAHLDTSLADLDLSETITGMLAIASRNGCTVRESVAAFLKQMVYIEGVCRKLVPDFDVVGETSAILSTLRSSDRDWLAPEPTVAA